MKMSSWIFTWNWSISLCVDGKMWLDHVSPRDAKQVHKHVYIRFCVSFWVLRVSYSEYRRLPAPSSRSKDLRRRIHRRIFQVLLIIGCANLWKTLSIFTYCFPIIDSQNVCDPKAQTISKGSLSDSLSRCTITQAERSKTTQKPKQKHSIKVKKDIRTERSQCERAQNERRNYVFEIKLWTHFHELHQKQMQ